MNTIISLRFKEFIERCKRQRVALADLKAILSNFTGLHV